jgi:glycosyltransferase involved in cell wall biosynthesis
MKLSQRYRFITKVICNEKPAFELPNLQFNTWCKTTEIEDLNAIDIGIMPLPNSLWTQGKCGFKLLQYMALEKAAVASAVGVNSEIIHHGQNGLLCQDDSDWYKNLELLLQNHELRIRLGRNGRNTVEKRYSKSSNTDSFLSLFSIPP